MTTATSVYTQIATAEALRESLYIQMQDITATLKTLYKARDFYESLLDPLIQPIFSQVMKSAGATDAVIASVIAGSQGADAAESSDGSTGGTTGGGTTGGGTTGGETTGGGTTGGETTGGTTGEETTGGTTSRDGTTGEGSTGRIIKESNERSTSATSSESSE